MALLFVTRGAIRDVHYKGDDEFATEIKKRLQAVVDNEDELKPWEELSSFVTSAEGGSGLTRNSNPNLIDLFREVYDRFLGKFPLLFGYWTKYADTEFSIGGTETAEIVFERAVACINNSPDLWNHYLDFKIRTCHQEDVIRELFERAATHIGIDWNAQSFWDRYLEFERGARDGEPNITAILLRVIHIPMQQPALEHYSKNLQKRIESRPVDELANADVLAKCNAATVEYCSGQTVDPATYESYLRTYIYYHYQEHMNATTQEVQKRADFERALTRQYFIPEDADDELVAAWRNYLDFEETQGNDARVVHLYDRCLVACAMQDDFWFRYARWLYGRNKLEDARHVYIRASTIFTPIRLPAIRLNWARFEEQLGRYDVAYDIYEAILLQYPNHEETLLSLVRLVRRQRDVDESIKVVKKLINTVKDKQVGGALVAEQARMMFECKGSVDRARTIFEFAHPEYLQSKPFWSAWFEFEIAQRMDPAAHDHLKHVHELMHSKAQIAEDTKKELSHLFMAWLLSHGDKNSAAEYMELDKTINGPISVQESQIKTDSIEPVDINKIQQGLAAIGASVNATGGLVQMEQ